MAYPQHFKLQAGDPNTPSLTSPISSSGICPIGYGGHDDLPNFLTDLAPASPSVISEMTPAVNDARTVARERIREAVRDRSLFQLDTSSTGLPHMSEMLIPPVLLPTSPSAFVLSFSDDQMMNADDLLRRVDPKGIAKDGESGLIVGGSGSGVSSALAWLVAEAAGRDENVYPVIIDLSVDPQGKHPVERLLRDQLRLAGLALGKRDDLPPVALGIDNLTAGPKVLERVAADLYRLELVSVDVGTTPVPDAEVHRALLTRALMPRYYIGQLAYNDIEAMLKLADTSLPASSAAQIMDFATEQGIAKTPFSISLMANVLRQGEELASSTSQTGLLDAYAMALLGQGASSEDARLGLDAMARAAILSTIAAEFVVQSSPTLSYSRIVGVVETMLEELAWEFQVSSVIQDFCERRVLSQMGNRVRFSQTSFLWVFAAKHADKNPDFLAQLSEQPLLYSSILERYAGISRRDRSLVLSLLGMVEEEISHLVDERVGSFESTKTRLSASPIPALVGVICEDGHDPEHGSLEVGEGEGGGAAVGEDDNLGDGDENGDLSQALMDRMANSSTDQDAFLDSVSDLSPLRRVMMGLELTSIAFRDAELVMDRGYKRDVIGRLLEAWASAVDLLGADADVAEGFRREGLQLAELFEADDIAAEELVGRLSLFGPFLLGVGLMVERLSSAKLKVPLVEACREATEKRSEVLEGILVMAESLVWAIDPGQALEFAEQALGAFPSSPVLLGLMRDWETFIYLAEDGLDNYEVRLSSLIASKVVGPNDRSPAAKAQKNDVRMRLQKYRMSHARKSV